MAGTVRHFPVSPGSLYINNMLTSVVPTVHIRGSTRQKDWAISTSISGTHVVNRSIDTVSNDYQKWLPKPQQTAMTQLPRLPTMVPRSHRHNHVNVH